MPPKKPTGLAAFTGRQGSHTPAQDAHPESYRTKAKHDMVALTLRLTRDQWDRVHQLARSQGISLNRLAVLALSKVFEEKGLPGL